MSEPKIKLNTEWLSVCGGCHVALVDLHEKIVDVMKVIEIQRSPLLTDEKGYPPAQIGLITGSVRTDHDREVAKAMRASCDKIIAFGTCAVYGGIPGAALAHTAEDILDRVYLNNPSTDSSKGVVPNRLVPKMDAKITPLDEVIDVDLYLPGCPPHAAFIFDALMSLTKDRDPRAKEESICAKCNRLMKKTDVSQIKSVMDGMPDEDTCFLSQGYICLGSVTLNRCAAPCPQNGVVCTGCAGPMPQILTEPNRDIRTEVAARMSALTNIPPMDVVNEIEKSAKSYYAYAMASGMVRNKPTFLIEKWIEQVEKV
ncbi:MAG: methyl viologen-reducing hydrogenase [Deltaproteobacteria bacterium]|nr:methyl viologen-reducing hydrogenase [Deltaproteobacteria bacterium]MBN2673519.1 methyl viologen-reducing hydrogenase [Deltaproteobacteria bacterium]